MQIKENAVRESVQTEFIDLLKIAGAINLSDIFTKEDKDKAHYIQTRDTIMSILPDEFRAQICTYTDTIHHNTTTTTDITDQLIDYYSLSSLWREGGDVGQTDVPPV